MTDIRKGSAFDGYLRPKEEILWMAREKVPLQKRFRTSGLRVVAAILVTGFVLFQWRASGELLLITVGTVALVIVLQISLRRGWRTLFGLRPTRTYAVTNQRLLYRSKNDVAGLPLESVPSVSVFAGSSGRGTLSFGAFFPMWPDVDNAAEVKDIIDSAQKQRMRELAR